MDNVVEYEAKWIAGLNRGDVTVADEVFAPDCKIHITGRKEFFRLNEFKIQVEGDLDDYPGIQFTIEDQIVAEDRFVFRWVANGISLKGEPVQVEGLIIDQVENGKVVERWEKKQILPLTPDKCCTIVPYFGVLSGKLDEFKGLCKELVARTSKEPKCLYYGFSFDEHNEHNVHCREGYADADGLKGHIDNVKDLLKKVEGIAVIYRLEIHGPKDELKKLETLREDLKRFNPMFFTLEHGIRKLIIGGCEGRGRKMQDDNNQSKWRLPDDELRRLDRLALGCIIYLPIVGLATFFFGIYSFKCPKFAQEIPVVLIGIAGSAIAALTSCLGRYAVGFEREDGKSYPEGAKQGEGKFNRRFARWFFVRPFLGAIVAPVFIWGLSHFSENPDKFLKTNQTLGFAAFMAGLLAKSVLDLIKGLFKNVFRL